MAKCKISTVSVPNITSMQHAGEVMIAINSQCVGLRLSDSFLYYLKSIKKSGTAEPLSSYRLSPKLVDLVIPMQPADQEAAVNGTAKYPNNQGRLRHINDGANAP